MPRRSTRFSQSARLRQRFRRKGLDAEMKASGIMKSAFHLNESPCHFGVRTLRDAGFLPSSSGVRERCDSWREPSDYDVTTRAKPEEVMSLFPENNAVGAQFGSCWFPHG